MPPFVLYALFIYSSQRSLCLTASGDLTQFLLQTCKYANMGQRTRPSQGFLQDFPTKKSWQALVTVVFVVRKCFSSGPLALSRLQPAGDRQIRMVSFSTSVEAYGVQQSKPWPLCCLNFRRKVAAGPWGEIWQVSHGPPCLSLRADWLPFSGTKHRS